VYDVRELAAQLADLVPELDAQERETSLLDDLEVERRR